jgi:two-component system chemotaxis response regulator CheB
MTRPCGQVVVIGASAGGVHALLEIAQALPRGFPAPVCVVQHIGSNPSLLPELLRLRGPNHAMHAEDGQQLACGTLHVAPPDRHMLLEGERLRITQGPKENHSRPAIDPLFRSAALALGPAVIGVILSGQMDDGSAGLKAVKDCGGIAIVQDPEGAAEPGMPRSALGSVAVDHCVPLAEIAPLLARLVASRAARLQPPAPEEVAREVAINGGESTVDALQQIASPSSLTCPDCGGSLWEMKEPRPLRYRCHTGHAWSSLSLARAQKDAAEHALWSSVRVLREREMLLRRMAAVATSVGDTAQAAAGQAQADRIRQQADALEQFAEEAIWECLCEAIDADLIELWEGAAPKVLATLTPYGAELLHVAPSRMGKVWLDRHIADRKSPRKHIASYEELNDRADDDRPDPRAQEPWEIAAAREEEETLANGDRAPKVWILLGLREQWPMPGQRKGPTRLANGGHPATECDVHHGTRPPHNHYCVACDTSGIDAQLPRVEVSRRRHWYGSKLKGGVGAS